MRQRSKSLLASVLMLGAITGCESTDENMQISPLPVIEPAVTVSVNWEKNVGAGTQSYFSKLAPTVAYDKVFASDRQGIVAAFNAQTGESIWQVSVEEQGNLLNFYTGVDAKLSGGISAGYDKVVVGSENGMLYVLAQQTGELVWKAQVEGEILAKPLLVANKVIVSMGNGKVSAFDINDGSPLWSYQQDVPALSLRGTSGLAESQGAVFFGMANGKVSGVLIEDGRAIWEAVVTPLSGGNELASIIDIDATPLHLGDNLYAVGYNGNLAAIEMRTGKILWKRDYSSYKAMTFDGFNLYATTDTGHVVAVDRRSGLEKWTQLGLENRGLTAPAIFDGYVAVVDFEGILHLLSQESGEFVGQHAIDDDGHIAKPIVAGKQLYLQSKDGLLSAISIK